MTRAIQAEIFKLRTTRTSYGLIGGALGFVLVVGLLAALLDTGDPQLSDLMMIGFVPKLIAVVLGILCVTSEFRHGTITPSALVTPWRGRLALAKLVATLIFALALGLASSLLLTLIVAATGGSTDRALELIVGGTLAAGLSAALGVGLGALVRNQVGAIIGALVYLLMLEGLIGLIPGVADVLPKYGINGTSLALSGADSGDADMLAQVPGGLLLAGYAAVFFVAGIAVLRRRDVTA